MYVATIKYHFPSEAPFSRKRVLTNEDNILFYPQIVGTLQGMVASGGIVDHIDTGKSL